VTLLRLKAYDSLVDRSHAWHNLDVELIFGLLGVGTSNSDLDSAGFDRSGACWDSLGVLGVTRSVELEQKFNRLTGQKLNVVLASNAAEVGWP